jgi:hypothetical protein
MLGRRLAAGRPLASRAGRTGGAAERGTPGPRGDRLRDELRLRLPRHRRAGVRPRTLPDAAEVIDLIHDAGGVAVWAHPFWDIADPDAVLRTLARFCDLGLDGVEAFYVTHDRERTQLLAYAAERHELLVELPRPRAHLLLALWRV